MAALDNRILYTKVFSLYRGISVRSSIIIRQRPGEPEGHVGAPKRNLQLRFWVDNPDESDIDDMLSKHSLSSYKKDIKLLSPPNSIGMI